jgi:beta-mannosidase
MPGKIALDKGWRFKQTSSLNNGTATDFLPVAQFPTVSHLDLLHHGLIPDPYIDRNEIDTLWVNEADWTYRTEAIEPINLEDDERAILVFEGLDTVVDVYLNGQNILFSKNMHISHRIDVTDLLKGVSEASTLELRFRSAIHFSRQERDRIGYKGKDDDIHFGGSERLFLRKAQYHWGWDWGPSINTSGPWRPIYLETYVSRIYDLHLAQDVANDLKSADLTIAGSVENPGSIQEVSVELIDPSGTPVLSTSASISPKGDFSIQHKLENPELWYTFQYGAQPMYRVTASIPNVCSTDVTCGLRRLRLLQHPLKKQKGTAFVFEVNNIRLFCGGSDWIPGDFMLPRMTPERYETWVKLAKGGNQSMIRVWGGGIVEDEAFYNACDREGVLVWQDFLFACGNYPASDDYVDNVRHEAEQQVKRVRHHPSLALWCGNNEDYMLADMYGWELDYKDEKGPWDKTNFPARLIYERTLPDVCERLALDVPYWRSSPYGGEDANDCTVGDVHIWDGKLCPYTAEN